MLASRLPLSQVALECGMCDQPHFCRVFRRIVGVNPGAWRRQFPAGSAPAAPSAEKSRFGWRDESSHWVERLLWGASVGASARALVQIAKGERATHAEVHRIERPLVAESEPSMGSHIVAELISLARLDVQTKSTVPSSNSGNSAQRTEGPTLKRPRLPHGNGSCTGA